jgi:hypothetical protein
MAALVVQVSAIPHRQPFNLFFLSLMFHTHAGNELTARGTTFEIDNVTTGHKPKF